MTGAVPGRTRPQNLRWIQEPLAPPPQTYEEFRRAPLDLQCKNLQPRGTSLCSLSQPPLSRPAVYLECRRRTGTVSSAAARPPPHSCRIQPSEQRSRQVRPTGPRLRACSPAASACQRQSRATRASPAVGASGPPAVPSGSLPAVQRCDNALEPRRTVGRCSSGWPHQAWAQTATYQPPCRPPHLHLLGGLLPATVQRLWELLRNQIAARCRLGSTARRSLPARYPRCTPIALQALNSRSCPRPVQPPTGHCAPGRDAPGPALPSLCLLARAAACSVCSAHPPTDRWSDLAASAERRN